MLNRIRNLLDSLTIKSKQDRELSKQWMGQLNLPPGETEPALPKPKGSLYEQWVQAGALAPEDVPQESVVSTIIHEKKETSPVLSSRLVRYIIIEGAVIILLLLALAVVTTLLIVKTG